MESSNGKCGYDLIEIVMDMIVSSRFFSALATQDPHAAVQRLQNQLREQKPPSGELSVLDNLISPFLLLAAAEKM
jgi:hypothetical protein